MDLKTFFEHFDTLAEAPNGIQRLRELILDMAVRGKLVPQNPADESAEKLLKAIEQERQLLVEAKITRKRKITSISKDEEPYSLPHSWKWSRLCAVAHDLGQKKPDTSFSYIDVSAINDGVISPEVTILSPEEAPSRARKLVKKGTVIYSTVRPYLLNIAVLDREYDPEPIASTAFSILHPYSGIDKKYLYYLLNSRYFIQYVEFYQKGVAYPAISDTDLLKAPVPIPPLAEQKRIVAKVDELMALCDTLEAAQQTRNTLRQSLRVSALDALMNATSDRELATAWAFVRDNWGTMSDRANSFTDLRQLVLKLAVEGKLLDSPRHTLEEKKALLDNLMKQRLSLTLSNKDKEKLLDEFQLVSNKLIDSDLQVTLPARCVCDFITKGTTPAKTELLDRGEIPYIKVYNIVDNELDFFYKPAFISREVHEGKLKRSKVLPGDVLMNIVGPPLGKVAVVPDAYPEWNLNQALAIFRPIPGINRSFLYYTLSSFSTLKTVLNQTRGTAGQDNLSLEQCRDLRIPLFTLDEQKRIVTKVDELMKLCDQLEESLRQQQQQAEALVASAISHLAA